MQLSNSNKEGFSLLELSLVLLLILLLVTLSGTQTSLLNRIFVRNELEQLYTVCFYLKQCAIAQNKQQELEFDASKNLYRYHLTEHTLSRHVRFGSQPEAKGPPGESLSVITKPITFNNNTIVFHPDGIIQPGTVYLTDDGQRYTYALSCAVAQVSYLRKYQYTTKWIAL